MKLLEVATGKSTMAFTDYLSRARAIALSPLTIGQLHSLGLRLLKAGCVFEEEEDEVHFVHPHFKISLMQVPDTKVVWRSRCEIHAPAREALALITRFTDTPYFGLSTVGRLCEMDWAGIVKHLDAVQAAIPAVQGLTDATH
jgi:hypothetical protein